MVASLEEEVRSIQKELDGVQSERRALELQRKLLQCTAPAIIQNKVFHFNILQLCLREITYCSINY